MRKNFVVVGIIALLVLAGVWLWSYLQVKFEKKIDISHSIQESTAPVDDKENEITTVSSEYFFGTWRTAGNDFQFIEFTFNRGGRFVGYSYYLESPRDVFDMSGTWSIQPQEGGNRLVLKFDQVLEVPRQQEIRDQYKKWGQEFFDDGRVVSSLTVNSQGMIGFRWDGNLMEKAGS